MKLKKNVLLVIVFLVVALAIGATSYYFVYFKKNAAPPPVAQNVLGDKSNTKIKRISDQEAKNLIAEIEKVIDLPGEEVPTIATVTDLSKLSSQVFYKKAQIGDKVLIYTENKMAYLYRPSEKKIIQVGNVASDITPSPSVESNKIKVSLKNGTGNPEIMGIVENELKKAYPEIEIISKGNAAKFNYDKTVVVSYKESARLFSDDFAKTIKADLKDALPEGEKKEENAEVVIIFGKDWL